MPEILIDENAGFCFGVVKAIEKAEAQLAMKHKLHCLGDIVHNEAEIERLEKSGLNTISIHDFNHLQNETVLIRAHGEPPETYKSAAAKSIKIIDATCPIVLTLQKKIHETWKNIRDDGGQIVLFGKASHPEVIGLNGQAKNEGIIVHESEDLSKIDFFRPIQMFSQTTKSLESYQILSALVKKNAHEKGNHDVVIHPSVCKKVSNRSESLIGFATKHDCIVFVSGKKSSNGNYLYGVCKKHNTETYFISNVDEIRAEWFHKKEKIGISGATSTPAWLMEQVKERIEQLCGQ